MKLKVLGTQSPYSTYGHNCPGFLITNGNYKLMLDCGSGTHSMLDIPDDLSDLAVILTHLHKDHYNDIFNLQYSSYVFNNQERIEMPITICLPKTPYNIRRSIVDEENDFSFYYLIDEATEFNFGNMEISFCKMDHPYETYAVKVASMGKKIVYSSDTSFSAKDRLAEFARGADLLICESSLLKKHGFPEINSHLTAEQAGIIARDAGVKELMLTHFWPEESTESYIHEAKNVFENVIAAFENLSIEM